MHPNPIFRHQDAALNLGFARDRAFGVLAVNAEGGPLISHVPFLLSADGNSADLHLVRSNPIARALREPQPAVIAVGGPDSYISPDWYGIDDQVPTWNYVAVHLRGTLSLLPQDDMRNMLDRQSAFYEGRLVPKQPWLVDKLDDETLTKLLRQIVPCRLTISAVDGTWKLGQNKPDAARTRAAGQAQTSAIGSDTGLLSALMLAPPAR